MNLPLCLLVLGYLVGAEDKPTGYRDLFITLPHYQVDHKAPVVEKGDKPTKYAQQATYEWSGGRYENLTVTLVRDPAIKSQYSAETLKKEKVAPTEHKINDRRTLAWDFGEQKDLKDVTHRLVVLLGDDKALIIEQRGGGASLEEVAKKFDFAKVEKALAAPPR